MTLSLNPYPAYKHSGVSWLGEVPEHWELRRTKHLLRERSEKGFPNEPTLAATQTKGVVRKEDFEGRTVLALKDLELLKLVRVNDFVISLRSFQGGIEYARHQGIISPAYTILCTRNPNYQPYLAALFKSKPYVDNLQLHVTGIRQGQNIDYDRLSRSLLPLPPLLEQQAIVRYLDHLDRLTRRYIRAKQRLIALLNEQKQTIIHQAVTRGLDADVPLKPSGVEWIGEIPEHWRVSRVKGEMICLNHRRVPLNNVQRGRMTTRLYDYYGASGVIDKVDDYVFDGELILIAEDGANLVLRNLPLVIVARGRFWVNNHAHILKPKRGNLQYFAGVLEGINYLPWISGAAQPKLTKDRLMAIAIPVPPVEEQNQIMEQVRVESLSLDSGIGRARQEIELVREYRTRLIADVITGNVDVREAAARLPEEAEEPADEACINVEDADEEEMAGSAAVEEDES